jgi:hypothetical protein
VTTTLDVTSISTDPPPTDRFVLTDKTPGTWFVDHYGDKQQVHILQRDGTLKRQKPAKKNAPQ